MSRMRALRLVLALVIAFPALRAVPAYAWHGSGSITAMAIAPPTTTTPTTIYAGTSDRGVFKSTDGGATWSATDLTNIYVSALAIDLVTQALYAGTYGGGVYKGTDGGATWTLLGLTGTSVTALAIDPQMPTTLYAGAYWGGVFKSMDGGATWSPTGAGPFMVNALAIDPLTPNTIYAADAYVGDVGFTWYGGVFKSTDAGATWTATGLASGDFGGLLIDSKTPTTLYACGLWLIDWQTGAKGVFKSTDGGATWSTSVSDPSWSCSVVIDPQTPSTRYAGTASGVVKSTDGGTTWSAVNTGLTDILLAYQVGTGVGPLVIDPNNPTTLYAGTNLGVFKTTDAGAYWAPTSLFRHSPLLSLNVNPSYVIYGVPSTGTVTLATPAPAGGITVALSSDTPAAATVPASVTVPAGATNANFVVSTKPVTWAVRISATFDEVTVGAILMVYATTLDSLSLSPTSVPGGTPSTGTVHLWATAPAGGATITLSSSNPAVAALLASVTVPAGATDANFTVSTTSVTTSTAVMISADNFWAMLTVIPAPATTLSSVSLSPVSVTSRSTTTGTVTLSAGAPAGGGVVALASSDTAVATVPTSVTVTAGAISANFTVSTSVVPASATVTISGAYGGVTRSAVLTVLPASTTLASVSLNPASVTGGSPSSGTVILSATASAGGAVVTLSSSNPAVATVPAGVTVPAGATSGNFTVLTAGCTSDSVTISGTSGGVTRSAGLTVTLPTATDTVTIQTTDYFASKQELRVAVKSTNSTATLRVYVTLTGELIGQLTNGGDGTFRGQFYWPGNPMSITVRSSLCGSATSAVRAK